MDYVQSILYIVIVTKKSPMCQIMRFSFYCINGSIEGKHITLKNSNNTLVAMKSELHTEEFYNWCICPLSIHSCYKMIMQNSTHRRFFVTTMIWAKHAYQFTWLKIPLAVFFILPATKLPISGISVLPWIFILKVSTWEMVLFVMLFRVGFYIFTPHLVGA